jgi:hypothetical protein
LTQASNGPQERISILILFQSALEWEDAILRRLRRSLVKCFVAEDVSDFLALATSPEGTVELVLLDCRLARHIDDEGLARVAAANPDAVVYVAGDCSRELAVRLGGRVCLPVAAPTDRATFLDLVSTLVSRTQTRRHGS